MERAVITINGDVFHLPKRNNIEELAVAILQAARHESKFVDISDATDGSKRVLITPSSSVKIEIIKEPDEDDADGAPEGDDNQSDPDY